MVFPNTLLTNWNSVHFKEKSNGNPSGEALYRDLSGLSESKMGPVLRQYSYKDTLCIWESFYDTIYGISKDKQITPRFWFKQADQYTTLEAQKNNRKDHKSEYFFENFIEAGDYFFLSGWSQNRMIKILYNKNAKTYSEPVYNYNIMDHAFFNDLDGGIPFWPNGKIGEKHLFCIVEPIEFLRLVKSTSAKDESLFKIDVLNQNSRSNIDQLRGNISQEDNPIIMKVRMK